MMTTPLYGLGFDFGNSHATAALYTPGSDAPTLLTIPSVTAPGNVRDYVAMQHGTGQSDVLSLDPYDHLRPGDYTLSYNEGTEMFVGNLALRQTRRPSTGKGDMRRYWSVRALELLLVLAGTLIPDEHFSLLVVTGQPVEVYRNEDARTKMRRALSGSHTFTLNGRQRTADIKIGKVLMEGAGASLVLGLPLDAMCGIIDIGEFTTDVYATRGLEAITYMCGGAEIGISSAAERLNSLFERRYHRTLSLDERMRVLRASLAGTLDAYPQLYAHDASVQKHQLDAWVSQALRDTGHEVNEFVSSLWRSGSDGFSRIQVIGGGAHYLLDDVRKVIRRAQRSADPENDNARGYGWYANNLVRQRQQQSSNQSA